MSYIITKDIEYRIYVDDVNHVVNSIDTEKYTPIKRCNVDIRAIGFEDDSPLFKEKDSYYNKQFSLKRFDREGISFYRYEMKYKIEKEITHLKLLLSALDKEPVYESQINPPEDTIPINVESKLNEEYFKMNKFKAPEWTETDERIKNWLATPSKERSPKDKEELVMDPNWLERLNSEAENLVKQIDSFLKGMKNE